MSALRELYDRGYVYFIQGEQTRLIKIGISRNPVKRLEDHQTGSPDKLILLGSVLNYSLLNVESFPSPERNLHKQFAEERTHGEWFRPSDRLLAFIKNLRLKGAKSSERSGLREKEARAG